MRHSKSNEPAINLSADNTLKFVVAARHIEIVPQIMLLNPIIFDLIVSESDHVWKASTLTRVFS